MMIVTDVKWVLTDCVNEILINQGPASLLFIFVLLIIFWRKTSRPSSFYSSLSVSHFVLHGEKRAINENYMLTTERGNCYAYCVWCELGRVCFCCVCVCVWMRERGGKREKESNKSVRTGTSSRVCVCVCVRACVRACVRVCTNYTC